MGFELLEFLLILIKSEQLFLDYVKRFATEEALRETEKNEASSDDESSMSDFSEDDMAKDMELWSSDAIQCRTLNPYVNSYVNACAVSKIFNHT